MALDPDLEGFLELAEMGRLSGRTRALHELEVAQARADFEAASAILDPAPPAALQVRSLSLPSRDGQALQLRLYRQAQDTPQHQAAILYLHGGGNVVGSLDSHDSVCRRLAASGRHAVLALGYRLAPEHPFPTAVNDTLDAADWLAEHAGALGIDSRQVSVAGDSAGATLATVLAMSAQQGACRLMPQAQLLFYPVTDISVERGSHERYAEGYLLERDTLRWFNRHYCADAAQRTDWRASPLLAAHDQPQLRTYISLAEYDPLFDEGQAYAERLKASGTEVTLCVEQGLTHDFLRMGGISSSRVEGIYADVERWLQRS
ncbi:lipase [Pseudomonas sp. 1239]|uniref:alpha/beta hydrolase n=1 Tax=unclassified Pseudomonas TaxID=196821 RepID=UPI000B4EE65E|nr:alpha/beta hydrolase [Pseudomonas sp. 1239]OUM22386.1 lipase [Pseudomonas sp. 1239]